MVFHYIRNDNLPKCAWLAIVNPSGDCYVQHGILIETHKHFFVEGVWSGTFADGNFDVCDAFFGSGAIRHQSGSIIFVSSAATVDYLYYAQRERRLYCSNSLPCLLASLSDQLIEFDPTYSRINGSIRDGIINYERTIPTKHTYVSRLMYYNLTVESNKLFEVSKNSPPDFTTYVQYKGYLSDNLQCIIRNAKDAHRKTPLRILSTQSSGYDSTVINSLARDFHLDHVLSIVEPDVQEGRCRNPKQVDPSDSGKNICRSLGIRYEEINRRYFMSDPAHEYLYWASITGNQDMNLHQVKNYCGDGAVLLTGALGEIWRNQTSLPKNQESAVSAHLMRGDLSLHGLSEIRLHFGFVHAAIPYIGATKRECIFRISNSEDMRPWSLGGTYDRPIARRIAEEAGVPRNFFGQTKRAAVVLHLAPYWPHGSLLRREFRDWIRGNCKWGRLFLLYFLFLRRANLGFAYLYDFRNRLLRRMRLLIGPKEFLQRMRQSRPPRFGFSMDSALYVFCVNKAADFYKARLEVNSHID